MSLTPAFIDPDDGELAPPEQDEVGGAATSRLSTVVKR